MKEIHDAGFLCDHDLDQGTTMNKKIRNAQLAQYNFIFGQCLHHCHYPFWILFTDIPLTQTYAHAGGFNQTKLDDQDMGQKL